MSGAPGDEAPGQDVVDDSGLDGQPTFSVESQREFDVLQKTWRERVFVKLYVAARTSGLLAAIPDREWKTLCALATFMDPAGDCYPSQAEIARALGVNRCTAATRLSALSRFRWRGQTVVTRVRVRGGTGQFDRNRYTILPPASLSFGGEAARRRNGAIPTVFGNPNMDVANTERANLVSPNTNKNQKNTTRSKSNNKTAHSVAVVGNESQQAGDDLVEQLLAAGVTRHVARNIVAQTPRERIERQLTYLPFRHADDPGALVVRAIQEDWSPPAAFREAQGHAAAQEAQRREEEGERERRAAWERDASAFDNLPPDHRRPWERIGRESLPEGYRDRDVLVRGQAIAAWVAAGRSRPD